MKAVIYTCNGPPEVLELVEYPDPLPQNGEILLRVEAISVEGGDLIGRKRIGPSDPPRVMGYVAAGRIVCLGAGVTSFSIGDRVTSFGLDGSHAELRCVPADQCWAIPDRMATATGAAALVSFGTAALALSVADVGPDDRVLVTGATGGVGLAAIQLAAALGAHVIAATGSAQAVPKLQELGAKDVILTDFEGLSGEIRATLDGRGADKVIDMVGGQAVREAIDTLDEGGTLVLVGVLDFRTDPIDPVDLLLRRLTVTGCFLGLVIATPGVRRLIQDALNKVASGKLVAPIDSTFRLADAAAAHERAEQRGKLGRVIIVP